MHITLFGINLNEYEAPRGLKRRHTRTPGIAPQPYRSHRISGSGYEDLTEIPEVPGTGTGILQNFQKFRVLWQRRIELTEVPSGYKTCCTRTPGIVATGVQNLQKFRLRV